MISYVVVVTGAANGFGRLAASALARADHTVYASMRETGGRNASRAAGVQAFAGIHGVDLRVLELDVGSQDSVDAAVGQVVGEHGRIDVVVHAAGRMVFGPAEAFTAEQLAEFYDINVLSAQRVNRAILPHMRQRGEGLLVWISSGGSAGGTTPYLAPYVAAKAGMDALAVQYAYELSRWGIETTIVVPGTNPLGTDHFAQAAEPADGTRMAEYEAGPTAGLGAQVRQVFGRIAPEVADSVAVGRVVAEVVATPFGERPLRVHVDPGDNGAFVAFEMIDRARREMLHRVGLADLLAPRRIRPRPGQILTRGPTDGGQR